MTLIDCAPKVDTKFKCRTGVQLAQSFSVTTAVTLSLIAVLIDDAFYAWHVLQPNGENGHLIARRTIDELPL